MKTCTNCGAQSYRVDSNFCLKCGSTLPEKDDVPHINICTNMECNYHKSKFIYPDDAKFCDICGVQTAYGK